MKLWITASTFAFGLTLSSQAVPQEALNIMTIGDSMTEEYYYEFPFSAPDKSPLTALPGDANTMNWVEILHQQRSAHLNFGSYESSWPFGYSDWRQAGHEFNFGVPGADTNRWIQILNPILNPLDPDYDLINALTDPPTIAEMRDWYDKVDVIVIFLGGNDIRAQYDDLSNAMSGDVVATAFINKVIGNLDAIIGDIRAVNLTVPIVLADVPDLGSTPDKISSHPDPVKRANASAIVAALNQEVATLAEDRKVTLAPISNLTDQILSPDPLYIGAIEMIKDADPEKDNRPKYLFCWKGLHPSTNGQAIIANILLAAINTATGHDTPLLPDREIITDLLGLNPDQPFIDWATTAGLTDLSMTADIDGDGIPSLGEYLLDLNPMIPNKHHIAKVSETLTPATLILNYKPDVNASRLADITIQQSSDLDEWIDIPADNLIYLGSGNYQAKMTIGPDPGFFRMAFELKP